MLKNNGNQRNPGPDRGHTSKLVRNYIRLTELSVDRRKNTISLLRNQDVLVTNCKSLIVGGTLQIQQNYGSAFETRAFAYRVAGAIPWQQNNKTNMQNKLIPTCSKLRNWQSITNTQLICKLKQISLEIT